MSESKAYTIQNEKVFELVRERSRFVAMSFRLSSLEETREKLKEAFKLFPQATHYVYAFRLGPEGKEEFASDGGEPRGSAGRPVLGALRRFAVTNTLVVVARYFGGKKLGIRGLIEAYGEVAEKVLEISGRTPYIPEVRFMVVPAMDSFDLFVYRLFGLLRSKEKAILDREKGVVAFSIPKDEEEKAQMFLEAELARGTIREFKKEG